MNTEIARRLEHSLIDDHIGSIVFHDQNVFALANTFATLVRAYQIRREKSWEQDPEICRLAADSLCAFLATAPELAETGIWPGGLRKTADQGALALIEAFIEAAENVKASDA